MNSISDLADCNQGVISPTNQDRRQALASLAAALCRPLIQPASNPFGLFMTGVGGFGIGQAWAAGLPEWLLEAEGMVLIDRLIGQSGLPADWVLQQFRGIERQDKALALVNPPADAPVIPRSLSRVLSRNLDPRTVRDGRLFLRTHRAVLRRAEEAYGVPASVIGGILGVETRFGRFKGSYPAVDTLASLALLSDRRQDFFQQELAALLRLGHETGLDLSGVQSSFAGALGIPQFMPSSWQQWAVDFDQDGRVDLLASPDDAIGSVANFLVQHGWQRGLPSHQPLASTNDRLPPREVLRPYLVSGLAPLHTVGDLAAAGLLPKGLQLEASTPASLIDLPEPDQPPITWFVTNNFFAITRYNRSYLYAASVLSLAEAIDRP